MSHLQEFLDFLWEDTKGFVNLSIKSPDEVWSRSFAEWPRQRDSVPQFIEARNAAGYEVFMGPAMWREKPPKGEQYGNELFLGSHVLWAEFDGNAPESWDLTRNNGSAQGSGGPPAVGPGPAERGSAAATGPARATPEVGTDGPTLLLPSWINQTSGSQNQHVYWKLASFLTDPDLLQNLNRTLAVEYNADNCWDATRVLRPPETTNYGIGKVEREGKTYPVRVEEANRRIYPIQSFRQTPDFRPIVRKAMGNVPDIREVLAKHQWDEDFYKAFTEDPPHKKRSDVLQFLAYAGAEAGFTNEEIYSVLHDADDRWHKYTGRLDRDKWLIDHVERARAKHPLGEEILTFEGLLGSARTKGTEEANPPTAVPDKLAFNFNEFMEIDINVEWLIEGIVPMGGYGIIAGPNGIGKSQMGLRLCEAIVSQGRFLIWNCNKQNAKAMFLSLEMVAAELKQVLVSMRSYGPLFSAGADRFSIVPIGSSIPLDKPEGFKFLEKLLKEHKPDLLVIDSLSLAISGDFKDDKPVLEFNKAIRRLTTEFGVAIVVIHHNRKGQDKKFRYNELDDLYGSRFLSQDATFVLMIDKPKTLGGDKICVNPAKLRFDKSPGEIHTDHTKMDFINSIAIEAPDDLNFDSLKGKKATSKPNEGEKDFGL